MFSKPRHLSRTSLIVISICLLVLLTFFSLSYLNLRTIDVLQRSTLYFSEGGKGITLLRESDEALDKAEDYYRIYINSEDTSYRFLFLLQMDKAIRNLQEVSSLDSGFARQTLGRVGNEVDLYKDIAELKRFSDSVLLLQPDQTTDSMSLASQVLLRKVDKTLLDRYIAQTTDTVRDRLVSSGKRSFLGRLGALFSGKNNISVKREYVKGGLSGKKYADSTQRESSVNHLSTRIRNYYAHSVDDQLALNRALRDKERALAATNLSIVSGVEEEIKGLLDQAEAAGQSEKEQVWARFRAARASIAYIRFFSALTILVLIGLLVYNTYRTNEYEKAILAAKINAEKMSHLKSRFFSSVSHEIRSPLTGIIGFTEQVLKEEKNAQHAAYLRAIKTSSDHLLNVVNDLLDFSKLEAGKLRLVADAFDLREATQEVLFMYCLQAKKKGISLSLHGEGTGSRLLMGDAHRFKQILYNLIGNAVKFTERGSVEVRTDVRPLGKNRVTVTVSVKDTGPGIPRHMQDYIFEEFAQVYETDKRDASAVIQGTGLGLSVCRMLTELQGGTISVESTPRVGSTFTFQIPYPLAAPGEEPLTVRTAPLTFLEDKTASRILVVEDNELNVMLISHLLGNLNCPFDVASDGELAVQLFRDGNYGLVVTDINMPRLSGLELCELIRHDADTQKASTPVVALTAGMWGDDWETYRKAGINTIVPKPFKEESFRKIIQEYLIKS